MNESILTSVKKGVGGIVEADESFDPDIILHTNSVLSKLTQMGVGLREGFQIDDKTSTWEDFIGTDKRLSMVKSYVILNVRLLFDPPASSAVANAMDAQIRELGWRICEQANSNL